ncbi:DNA recombination protein RmuC [hydrothermal vent metagenome]|uniref:DNA recombination protein RmuC n=1 Tax=hydrothermal vent metagenome TaxID=652676 RepID=A0A3B1A5J0_9ZZZZ
MNALNPEQLIIIIPIIVAIVTGLVVYLLGQNKYRKLEQENISLATTLELERNTSKEKLQALENAREQLTHTFSALSSQALKHNNEEFLKLANENLKKFQNTAQHELSEKEKAIETLVKPIKEALEKNEQQMHSIEKDRKHAYGALQQQLETMSLNQSTLQSETRNLVQALRRPEVRGQWGEMTLKRLAELAGMVEHCDFYTQESIKTEDALQRPDMIVRMPDGREIVVDVKTPLDAYLTAVEASSDEERDIALQRHCKNVKQRVNELASKAYWNQLKNTPDFVVLFIPGDQFLSTALDYDHGLLEDALSKQIILATPTSFVALLRAVAYGWRQEQLAENADKIRDIGEDLYQRLAVFSDHLAKLGKSLDASTKNFNSAVGSFDTRILPSARKFKELGINEKKSINQPEQIETATRSLESTEID